MKRLLAKVFMLRLLWAYVLSGICALILAVTVDVALRFHAFFPQGAESSVKYLWTYYADFLPLFFLQVSPVLTLAAALFVLGPMRRRNELEAMAAAGYSPLIYMIPLCLLALAASCGVGFVQEFVLTSRANAMTAHRIRLKIARKVETPGLVMSDGAVLLYRSISEKGVFRDAVAVTYVNSWDTIYEGEKGRGGEGETISPHPPVPQSPHPNRVPRIKSVIFSDNASLSNKVWTFGDAKQFEYSPDGRAAPARTSALKIYPQGLIRGISSVKTFSFPTLSRLGARIANEPGNARLRAAFWGRMVYPFLHMVLAVFGVGIFMTGEGGQIGRRVVYALLGAVVLYFTHLLFLALVSTGQFPAIPGALFVPVVGLSWGGYLVAAQGT